MKFKPDAQLRQRLMVSQSMRHPAKGHMGLWWEILEKYTEPGQMVLDSMAGTGTTLLGCLMGRNVICVEMEQHFVEPMQASWTKMRQSPMLGCTLGQALIIRGDARFLPLGRVDSIVTSPPYEGSMDGHQDGFEWDKVQRPNGPNGQGRVPQDYDAVITSPPYEQEHQGGVDRHPERMEGSASGSPAQRYTRLVDAVVTSPPWQDREPFRDKSFNLHGTGPVSVTRSSAASYGKGNLENIGNLRSDAYWGAMRLVFSECHRVLKPGGLMVLVVKGYTQDGQYVDLPQQTIDCCESLGFRFYERWERELWNLSFWRILQGSEKKTVKMGLQMGLTEEEITEVIRDHRVSNGKLDDRLRFESILVLARA